ncbi:pyrroline-5-carboxylate reductase [Aquibacillus albus]|uniref:Pyrroline-5-carboxylate reductase n=1 Tax=Aquibacillus albus TaxID=1168171 RepID=A0ABS2MZ77_9BACI|nr:pyrroline-5-carboxylate reductase [Aquibacillus albus]
MKKNNILFVGAGRMAQAIIGSLMGDSRFNITVTNSGNKQRLKDVQETYGVRVVENWKESIENVDLIVLAAPPDVHASIIAEMNPWIKSQLVVTVAAGIGPSWLEERLPHQTSVVWLMPNTAAKVGQSSTLCALGQHVDELQLEMIKSLLTNIGSYEIVSEHQVHQLTAITGSSPAFVYQLAEGLVSSAKQSGVTEEQAKRMVAQMILGAASMLKTGESPQKLIDEVATPGGSTAAGLQVLDYHHFTEVISEAVEACRKKASKDVNE